MYWSLDTLTCMVVVAVVVVAATAVEQPVIVVLVVVQRVATAAVVAGINMIFSQYSKVLQVLKSHTYYKLWTYNTIRGKLKYEFRI